jgi:hypothetical protein
MRRLSKVFPKWSTWYEIFYVMKIVGKIHLDISFIGRIDNFHFGPILEFKKH